MRKIRAMLANVERVDRELALKTATALFLRVGEFQLLRHQERELLAMRTMVHLAAFLRALGIGRGRSMIFITILCIGLVCFVRLCALSGLGFFVHHGGEVPNALLVVSPIGS